MSSERNNTDISKQPSIEKNQSGGSDTGSQKYRDSTSRSNAIKEFAERKWIGKVGEQKSSSGDQLPNSSVISNFLAPAGPDLPDASLGLDPASKLAATESEKTKKEYEDFQRHVTMAFRLQEAKVVSSRLQTFQQTHIYRSWFHFHFLDGNGVVDEEAELQFESEWWVVVVYWLTFIFFMVILGFVVVSVADLGSTDFLMSRIGSRVMVTIIGACFLCVYPKFSVLARRRMLTLLCAMYFTALIMTDRERVMKVTGPLVLNWYSCAEEYYLDCDGQSCRSILPFLTSQCSLVATFLRLPFHHMAYLVAYVCFLYLSTGFFLQVSLFQESQGLMYEVFCLLMAFGVLVLAARRVEILSRFLFLRTRKDDNTGWALGIPAGSPSSKASVTDDDTFFQKMIAVIMKGTQSFVGKKSFMKFESLVVFGSGHLNLDNISFYDKDMEFCFRLGRWEVTKKWCFITFFVIFPGFVALSIFDIFSITQEKFCGEESIETCSPSDFILARIIPRAAWVLCSIIIMGGLSRQMVLRMRAMQQVSTGYNYLLAVIIWYFTTIIMIETVRLAGLFNNNLVCAAQSCKCYAMLSFVTAQFSYMLVMIRLPFNMTMVCLLVVSVVYIVSGVLINVDSEGENAIMYEISCLLLMCFCFTISAHRSDVLARAHFLLEYGATNDEHLAEEVEKKLGSLKGKERT